MFLLATTYQQYSVTDKHTYTYAYTNPVIHTAIHSCNRVVNDDNDDDDEDGHTIHWGLSST
ncbi:hypothetical protein DOY81_001419 [Sarcophaga bullata]|nr:hypothetical protein DOY81_001419 [Sarcophaga bullata]